MAGGHLLHGGQGCLQLGQAQSYLPSLCHRLVRAASLHEAVSLFVCVGFPRCSGMLGEIHICGS